MKDQTSLGWSRKVVEFCAEVGIPLPPPLTDEQKAHLDRKWREADERAAEIHARRMRHR